MKPNSRKSLAAIGTKCIFFVGIWCFSPTRLHAQGTVNFAGKVAAVYDAPVFVCENSQLVRASGSRYFVQLYAGIDELNLVPVGTAVPFRTGAGAGYWTAAARFIDAPLLDQNSNTTIQIRAWDTTWGTTFETTSSQAGPVGKSNLILVHPSADLGPPPGLNGLQSFVIGPAECPEPSTWALLLAGLGIFFFKQRQNAPIRITPACWSRA